MKSGESFLCCFIHETDAHWCLSVSGTARHLGVAKGYSTLPPCLVARETMTATGECHERYTGAIRQHWEGGG